MRLAPKANQVKGFQVVQVGLAYLELTAGQALKVTRALLGHPVYQVELQIEWKDLQGHLDFKERREDLVTKVDQGLLAILDQKVSNTALFLKQCLFL